MWRRKDVTIGFSVNPEIYYEYAESLGEKGALDSFTISLAGTSANVATALKNFGYNPLLVVPCEDGESDTDTGHLLEVALRQSRLTHVRLPVLEQTPLAIYPVNEDRQGCLLYGRKGLLTHNSQKLARAIEEIGSYDGHWRIATGVDPGVALLAWHLLGEEKGLRVLSPNYALCHNPDFSGLSLDKSPLSRCDLLIVNRFEFETLGRPKEIIHGLGVSLIIITDGERGGRFSVCNEATDGVIRLGTYQAVQPPSRAFSIGAGDWFLGGFVTRVMDMKAEDEALSLATLPFKVIQEACDFGARVAGFKVAMRGGSSGPTRAELV